MQMLFCFLVYLRTDPETLLARIKKRARPEEMMILSDFLYKIHELHEEWLNHQKRFPLPAPIITLNGNGDLSTMKDLYKEAREQIVSATKAIPV